MYANYKLFDRDGRKKNLREGLPAYAYSRYVCRIIIFFKNKITTLYYII